MTVFSKWLLGGRVLCFVAMSRTILGRSLLLVLFFLGWASTVQAEVRVNHEQDRQIQDYVDAIEASCIENHIQSLHLVPCNTYNFG